jgi:uncharacterized membrane protein YqaE (UPF0057 family)
MELARLQGVLCSFKGEVIATGFLRGFVNDFDSFLIHFILCYADQCISIKFVQSKIESPPTQSQAYRSRQAPNNPSTMSDAAPALLIVLITILCPPIGVFLVSGCGADLLVNICLTILGYLPGHIHAFYIEYVYFDRRGKSRLGQLTAEDAPGIYSQRVQTGGTNGYGTI